MMKDKVITFSFVLFLFSFFLWSIIEKDQMISLEERRHLEQFPKLTYQTIMNGEAMKQWENYTTDQFPARKIFRAIKANTKYYGLHEFDNNKLFLVGNKIMKLEYPENEKSVSNFIQKLNKIQEEYLQNNSVYIALIPDKNYYLNDSKYLKIDYDKIYQKVQNGLPNMKYLEFRNLLSLDSYYDTDTHWRQEKIVPIANMLSQKMTGTRLSKNYQEHHYQPFYGVYYGQAAVGGKGEKLTYLTNSIIEQAFVENYEDPDFHQVYKTSELGQMDSYNVFLSGATPYISISNKQNTSGKELIIFRDSFGSSLAPLLLEAYSKITLVDLRYIDMKHLCNMISFNQQDVLFLYSTMVVNQSDMLKI